MSVGIQQEPKGGDSLTTADLGGLAELHSGRHWDSGMLRAAIGYARAAFIEAGVGASDRVVIGHGGAPEFFAELLALWSLKAAAVCVNPTVTRDEMVRLADFVEARCITRREAGMERTLSDDEAAGLPVLRLWEEAWEGATKEEGRGELLFLEPADWTALILFTSGTTGDPKGVVQSARSLCSRILLNQERIGREEMKRSLCVLPTHFGHGLIGNSLTPLFAGCELLLYCNPGVAGAARLGAVIDRERVTFLSSVPSFWKLALKIGEPPRLGSLRRVHVGSAPLSADLWQAIEDWSGAAVWNLYGLTETANWTAAADGRETKEDGLVGRMWGGKAGVLSDKGEVRTEGEGEILLYTPSLMSGYYKRPDLTEEALAEGWYRTGDHGRVSSDGTIRLIGRRKNEINRAGMKVLPEEIDLLLERHEEIAEACAFGLEDAISGEIVAVALVLREGASLDGKTLAAWCAERIRRDCIPERWFFVSEIPKTDRGKINRDRVREYCLAAR